MTTLIQPPFSPNVQLPTTTPLNSLDVLKKLKRSVFNKRPMLKEILRLQGSLSLHDFTKSHIATSAASVTAKNEKREQLIGVIEQSVQDLLGSSVAASVAKQIRTHNFVITADHHGPISSPHFTTSNLLEHMAYSDTNDDTLANIIVLSCANVSFDNYSFPRGMRFHAKQNGKIAESHIGFFGRTVDSRPVINFRPYTYESIVDMKKSLDLMQKDGQISSVVYEKLHNMVNEIYAKPSVLARHNYSDQITMTNFHVWKNFFSENKANTPNLIYLEQEEIAMQLLIMYHLYQDTAISKLLFKRDYHKLLIKHFDGIMGAFSTIDNSGTFLFWAIPPKQKYRVGLHKNGRFLVSHDGSYQVELTPSALHTAILNKEIFPSTLLTFTILGFHYGLRLLGGFNQTTYLTQMKESYVAMQQELGNSKEAAFAASLPTTQMVFTRPSLFYITTENGSRVAATGLDLMLYKTDETQENLIKTAKDISLNEAMYRLFPYLYRSYYPLEHQDSALLTLTEDAIEKSLGLDKKNYYLSV